MRTGMRGISAGLLALSMAAPAIAAPVDCSNNAIPGTPVKGTVKGKPFVPKEVTLAIGGGMAINDAQFDAYDLTLMADGIFNALSARVLVRKGTKADGRVFRMVASDDMDKQPMAAAGTPEVQSWNLQLEAANIDTDFTQETASLRLEFGKRKGGVLPGKIFFCTLDPGTRISGSFDAKIGQ